MVPNKETAYLESLQESGVLDDINNSLSKLKVVKPIALFSTAKDGGESKHSTHFYLMPFIEGEHMIDLVEEAALCEKELCEEKQNKLNIGMEKLGSGVGQMHGTYLDVNSLPPDEKEFSLVDYANVSHSKIKETRKELREYYKTLTHGDLHIRNVIIGDKVVLVDPDGLAKCLDEKFNYNFTIIDDLLRLTFTSLFQRFIKIKKEIDENKLAVSLLGSFKYFIKGYLRGFKGGLKSKFDEQMIEKHLDKLQQYLSIIFKLSIKFFSTGNDHEWRCQDFKWQFGGAVAKHLKFTKAKKDEILEEDNSNSAPQENSGGGGYIDLCGEATSDPGY
jgi:hypothetical protein